MTWMIARDDNCGLKHYGVKGMKWKRSKAGMPTNSSAIKGPVYNPYGPVDKLNRPTHGSTAGVPSNLFVASRFSKTRTANSKYAGDGDYRTTAVYRKLGNTAQPVASQLSNNRTGIRKSNTELSKQAAEAFIKKKLRSNNRYKASRAGMPSYIRR